MTNRIENIVIVGGGTAGWLAANYLNRSLNRTGPHCKITLIESSEIETVGVGEATLPTLRGTLHFLGFDEREWMVRCNATFKLTIKFVNWLTGNDAYWFPFQPPIIKKYPIAEYWLKRHLQGGSEPLSKAFGAAVHLCEKQKSAKTLDQGDYEGLVNYAYQLDAGLLAAYLKEKAIEGGVEHIVDNVLSTTLTENGFINHLTTDNNGDLSADLFIDCSGFRGLLINQALQEPFVSFRDVLFCDQAVAINVPTDDMSQGVNPYTTATALSSGWVWHIPLYGRTGNGYVYGSNFISSEAAEIEFRQHLGPSAQDIEARHLQMRIGHNRRVWVKNCVSLGLASGFIEPLESTGIFLIEVGLEHLVRNFPDKQFSPIFMDNYNRIMTYYYEEIRDFITLHYCITRRTDTPFWQAYRFHKNLPDNVQARLEQARVKLPSDHDFLYSGHLNNVLAYAYTNILGGMNYLPEGSSPILDYEDEQRIDQVFAAIQIETEQLDQTLPEHYQYLQKMHLFEPLRAVFRQENKLS